MRRPSFQFYPSDWLSSPRIAAMTPSQEGAYIRLLCYDWDKDGIPNDPDLLAKLSRIPLSEIGVVIECFNQHFTKPGYLTNSRLQEERLKQDEWRKKSILGGKKGASKRWSKDTYKENRGGHTLVNEWLQPKYDSPSPSPSPVRTDQFGQTLNLMGKICGLFGRNPKERWPFDEERAACEVSKRADALKEIEEILDYYRKPEAKPRQTVLNLLTNWAGELDKARNYERHQNNGRNSGERVDRNKGTFNEGKAHLYANAGNNFEFQVLPGPNPPANDVSGGQDDRGHKK